MIRRLQRLASVLFALSAIAFAGLWNERRQLPFNEQGRYFDAANGTVLHEQSVTAYGALAVTFALLAVTSWLLSQRAASD